PVPDEREEDRDQGVGDEAADEDALAERPFELRADGTEDRVHRGDDADGRVPGDLIADADLEDETQQDAQEQPSQGDPHVLATSLRPFGARLPSAPVATLDRAAGLSGVVAPEPGSGRPLISASAGM